MNAVDKNSPSIIILIVGMLLAISSGADPSIIKNSELHRNQKTDTKIKVRQACVEDYAPCTCNDRPSYGLEITCDNIETHIIRDVLSRTTTNDLFSIQITVPTPINEDVVTIPTDLLSGKRAGNILLTCPFPTLQLVIDPDAFRSSSEFTFFFFTAGCDLNLLDFASFLSNFSSLSTLFITQSSNVQGLQNLPALPSLIHTAVTFCTGLERVTDFSRLGKVKLQRLWLNGNQLGDQVVNSMLNSIAGSPSSASALEMLWLTGNQLTRIPTTQLAMFTQLVQLDLSNNTFPVIVNGSFVFKSPVDYLYLEADAIYNIEPGAFQGDFSMGQIYLRSNAITRFEENVFKSLLEQMVSANKGGFVNLEENPLNCNDCHLAWLVRDNPALLAAVDSSAKCSDGTALNALGSDYFTDCSSSH